ncbi:lipoprotein-releasing ABC transporter permease subunit [Paraferrimonas sp. SM1919]|uniref:lipoprotein-releasing ABC transporter permease subunit n=1 Tax=Paraferrimonas sp. SM1919 TaxID=2662263 RepID=UPI0013CFA711|nr:lipoprotein-releasing ABC transporter permease subunit [Paraferrimonas sp. SM1919]
MKFALTASIGWRYWRSRKNQGFTSFITFFSVTGIVLGVAALILVGSVMNGLEDQLKQRILTVVPQVIIHSDQTSLIEDVPLNEFTHPKQVLGVSPLVQTQVMMQAPNQLSIARLQGVIPENEAPLSMIDDALFVGSFESLVAGQYGVLIGAQLAQKLSLSVGDKVRLMAAKGVSHTPMGMVPSQRNFTVKGIFEMGSEVDASLVIGHYQDIAKLTRQSSTEFISARLYLDDPFDSQQVIELLKNTVDLPVTYSDWRKDYGQLFAAVEMEKKMMSLMLSLIVIVAAFNIISALVMMVIDKRADVAILKTQGLTKADISSIFVIQGMLNALIGLFVGVLIGLPLALQLDKILASLGVNLLGTGVKLPVIVEFNQILSIVLGTLVITLLATLYPALKAASIAPAEALRNE